MRDVERVSQREKPKNEFEKPGRGRGISGRVKSREREVRGPGKEREG